MRVEMGRLEQVEKSGIAEGELRRSYLSCLGERKNWKAEVDHTTLAILIMEILLRRSGYEEVYDAQQLQELILAVFRRVDGVLGHSLFPPENEQEACEALIVLMTGWVRRSNECAKRVGEGRKLFDQAVQAIVDVAKLGGILDHGAKDAAYRELWREVHVIATDALGDLLKEDPRMTEAGLAVYRLAEVLRGERNEKHE